jgi:hypothetical protein
LYGPQDSIQGHENSSDQQLTGLRAKLLMGFGGIEDLFRGFSKFHAVEGPGSRQTLGKCYFSLNPVNLTLEFNGCLAEGRVPSPLSPSWVSGPSFSPGHTDLLAQVISMFALQTDLVR